MQEILINMDFNHRVYFIKLKGFSSGSSFSNLRFKLHKLNIRGDWNKERNSNYQSNTTLLTDPETIKLDCGLKLQQNT